MCPKPILFNWLHMFVFFTALGCRESGGRQLPTTVLLPYLTYLEITGIYFIMNETHSTMVKYYNIGPFFFKQTLCRSHCHVGLCNTQYLMNTEEAYWQSWFVIVFWFQYFMFDTCTCRCLLMHRWDGEKWIGWWYSKTSHWYRWTLNKNTLRCFQAVYTSTASLWQCG